jgi:hypothetical protein
MAVDTVEKTTKATRGKSRRGRASRSKASARKAASRHIANLRASAEQVLRQQNWTGETRIGAPRRFARIRLPRRSDFRAITKANPMALSLVGLGIGMILATIIPKRISARLRNRTVSRLAQPSEGGRRR